MTKKTLATSAQTIRGLALLLILAAWGLACRLESGAAEKAGPVLEPLKNVSQETRTPIKFQVKVRNFQAPPRFAIDKLAKGGQAAAVPPNMKVAAATGAFSWTPTPSQAGVYDLTLSVKDAAGRKARTMVRVTVRPRSITTASGPVGDLLRKWYAAGTAAGNTGDFFDNRDRDHSPLNLAPYPQLDQVTYTADERKKNLDWAAQRKLHETVTFGNSSTSAHVLYGGSNPRFYQAHPRGMPFLYQQYRKNNLYIYPAHHDHHPGHNGKPYYGDVYPTNSPYLITSQGSSGSDQPFMRAVPFTLAAFRPEVKKKLIETGLLMPTVQMIFRSSNSHLKTPKDYLTGKAHPPVFEGSWVDDLKMVKAAHAIRRDNIPPLIQLKVVNEDAPVEGKDYFEAGRGEKLCDTPAVIGRVVRGSNYVRRIEVSAQGSFDVNKKPITYHWVVLRGDPTRITIKPKNASGSVVEIRVSYHARCQVAPDAAMASNRVDIGAFVSNGTYYSAPGFITFFTLDSEARTYDKTGRLLEIGYGAGDADLTVSDWNALFDVLAARVNSLADRLLTKQLTVGEVAALLKVGKEYKLADSKRKATMEKSQKAAERRNQATASLAKEEAKLKAAAKAHREKPGDAERKTAFQLAAANRDAARADLKRTEAAFQAAQKVAEAANKAAEEVLDRKRDGLRLPARALLERGLEQIKSNPSFLLEHPKEIEALARTDAAGRSRLGAVRKRLVGLGILKPAGSKFKLRPLRGGDTLLAQRLTRYEKNMLERANAEVLSGLICPRALTSSFRVNFVDQRLSTPNDWRDVYHYDSSGNQTGWTRYDGESAREFTAQGLAVLQKDALGRVLKARRVKYEYTPRRAWFQTLKQVWGNQVLHYEYANAQDRKGRVKKTETVDEKKNLNHRGTETQRRQR